MSSSHPILVWTMEWERVLTINSDDERRRGASAFRPSVPPLPPFDQIQIHPQPSEMGEGEILWWMDGWLDGRMSRDREDREDGVRWCAMGWTSISTLRA